MSIEPEGPWAVAMIRVSAIDPRNGRPSWNRLAEMADVSTSTVTKMVGGTRKPSVSTVQKVADALRVDASDVWEWIGRGSEGIRTYHVPDEVHLLTPRQQNALTELIRATAEEQQRLRAIAAEREGGEADGDAAPTKSPSSRWVTTSSTGQWATDRSVKKTGGADYVVKSAARTASVKSRGQAARAAQDDDAHQ